MIAAAPKKVEVWATDRKRGGRRATTRKEDARGIPPAGAGFLANRPDWLDKGTVSDAIERASLPGWSPAEEARLCSALAVIPADLDGQTWAAHGMAMADLVTWIIDGVDRSLEIFDRWSFTSKGKGVGHGEYKGRADIEYRWKGWKEKRPDPNVLPTTIKSIYHHARKLGWVDPRNVNTNKINGQEALTGVLPAHFTAPASKDSGDSLITLNNKHAVISNLGNQPVVLEMVESPIKGLGQIPTFITFKHFADRYCNQYHTVEKEKLKKDGTTEIVEEQRELGRFWLHWSDRTTYEGIGLSPEGDLPANYFNLWKGWAITPKQGDWSRMKGHIQHVLGNNDPEAHGYVVRWAAWAVQHPGEKAVAALVLKGDEGVGKGIFATTLLSMFGAHGLHIHRSKHMLGFNAMLRTCLLLYADEAFWAGDKEGESTLKGLITDPTIMIEQKRIDAVPWPNRLHIIMAANAEWVVPARHDARRYGMIDVSNCKAQDALYFEALAYELDHGGREAMLYDLLNLNLDGWHPRRIPNTAALRDQKALSMDWRDQWWADLLQRGSLPFRPHFTGDDQNLTEVASAKILMAHAADYATNARNCNPTALGRYLGKKGKKCFKHHSKFGEMWEFPPLDVLRSNWEKHFGGWEWDLELAEWQEKNDW